VVLPEAGVPFILTMAKLSRRSKFSFTRSARSATGRQHLYALGFILGHISIDKYSPGSSKVLAGGTFAGAGMAVDSCVAAGRQN
jgi:hypothetical protein